MSTIKLGSKHSKYELDIRELAEHEELYNPNFSGDAIAIEIDEHTCVECADEIAGAALLRQVFAKIEELEHS